MSSGIGERLRMARRLADMTQEQAAEQVGLSKMAISKYENEKMLPSSDVLIRLANTLGQPTEFFLRGPVAPVTPVYRGRKTLKGKHEDAIVAQLQEWLDRYLAAESLYPPTESVSFAYPVGFPFTVATLDDVEEAADALRLAWGLSDVPIDNLTQLLEDKGIKVGVVDGNDRFDACLFRLDDDRPVMAVKSGLPGDRQRINLAHELGHLMLYVDETVDEEKAAFRFGAAFLVPKSAAYRELGTHRQSLGLQELHLLKHKYGLSMQAWVYRARDLGIVDEATAVSFFKWFRRNGYHRQEPYDALPEETPERLTRLVLRAVAEDVVSHTRAAELLGMPWLDFQEQQAEIHGEVLIAVGA